MDYRSIVSPVILGVAVSLLATAAWADTIYVDDDAPNDPSPHPGISDPLEDGTPEHPFDAIQEGIDNAVNGDEIVIADGLYYGPGNRDLDFGGKLITVRSANGPANCEIRGSMQHRGFLFMNGETADAVVEGVTISASAPPLDPDAGYGGAIYCSQSSPTIRNCVMENNKANGSLLASGGAVYCGSGGDPTFISCTISANIAPLRGGGIFVQSSSPTFIECVISDNQAAAPPGTTPLGGGGIYIEGSSNPVFTGCTISGNISETDGGGAKCVGLAAPTLIDCSFTDNAAQEGHGGGFMFDTDAPAHPTLSGCTFTGNSAEGKGAGVFARGDGELSVTGCTFTLNAATLPGGGMKIDDEATAFVTDCLFDQNTANFGGGLSFFGTGSVTRCSFTGNTAGDVGGGLSLTALTGMDILDCVFLGNSTEGNGGGLRVNTSCTMVNCAFEENSAVGNGGAVFATSNGGTVTFKNCTIAGNTAGTTGGVHGTGADPVLVNCIISGNSLGSFGGSATPSITYSLIEEGAAGVGNISGDPMFVDPGSGDYRLMSDSPCIDAGDNTAVPEGITTDLDGNPRFVDDPDTLDTGNGDPPIVDMGAYEFQTGCPWDCGMPADGQVSVVDFLALLATWGEVGGPCDVNGGSVDVTDFLALLAFWGPCP
ncbi:MAG: right-handed parallel beta-helix repeat-containing protein [Planctomycetota bacterium]|jgi:predicted outer membrane repeat protein